MTGLPAWLVQRASALYLLAFIVYLCGHFLADPPHSYEQWRAWVNRPGVAVAALVFFAALLTHAWVGLRDVILDYVNPPAVRIAALGALGLGLAALGAWIVRILA